LTPSLYRYRDDLTVPELVGLEAELLTMFRQRSVPHYPPAAATQWDYYFVMQHFGVPTRLLDWSENALIALYFAVLDAEHHRGENAFFAESAAVWVLDPELWNDHALADLGGGRRILSTTEDIVDPYRPGSPMPMRHLPLALYGAHTNPRIVAQRGSFVIFGGVRDSMESHYEDRRFPDGALLKIELSTFALGSARDSIDALGMTESMIYPDLEGLARELTRRFGLRR